MMRSTRRAVAFALGVLAMAAAGAAFLARTDPGAASHAGPTAPASTAPVSDGPTAPIAATPQVAADTPSGSFATYAVLAPHEAAKAEALIRRRLPCLGCHRLGDEGGRIGPDLTAVGERRSYEFVLRMIRDPQGMVPGTVMPRVPMPSGTDVLVAGYLAGIRAAPGGAPDAVTRDGADGRAPEPAAGTRRSADGSTAGSRATDRHGARTAAGVPTAAAAAQGDLDGGALYARYCAACHGADGGGDGPNARHLPVAPTAHADSAYMSARPDDALFDAIYAGGRIMGRSHRMPAWGLTLSRAEIRALVGHLRALCGCEAPAWSRDGAGGRE